MVRIYVSLLVLVGGCSYYDYTGGVGCDVPPPYPCEGDRCTRPVPDGGPSVSDAGARACRVDGDCAPFDVCSSGVCVAGHGCAADADCSAREWCDARGTCVAAVGCRADADCASGELCVEGACVATTATCEFDVDCGPGRSCVDAACRAVCGAGASCGTGDACVAGTCRPGTCRSSDECGDAHCVSGRCADLCVATSDCPSGDLCVGGACRPDVAPRPFCVADSDCATGSRCVAGVCRIPCASGDDLDCQRSDTSLVSCRDSLCYTAHQASPECRSGADCGGGQSCVDAVCR